MVVLSVINLKPYRKFSLPAIGPLKVNETFTHSLDTDPQSLLDEEGVFGIELFATKEKTRMQLFSSKPGKGYRAPVLLSREKQDLKQVQTFYIAGSQSSIFPFSFQPGNSIWDGLKEIISSTIKDQKVFIQVLAEQQDITERMGMDYELYQKGVQNPSSFYPKRFFQEKYVEWAEKHNWMQTTSKEIPQLQQKMSEDGYKVCIKLAIYGGNNNTKLLKGIMSVFRNRNGANFWSTFQVSIGKKTFIEGIQLRKFPLVGRNLYLCKSEIQPMFEIKQEVPIIDKPIVEAPKPKAKPSGSIIECLPHGDKMERKEDSALIEQQINSALKKVGLVKAYGIKITKLQNGSTLKKVTFTIPEKVKLSQIESNKKDIQAELGIKNIAVEQGETAGTAAILIPQEKRTKVFLRDLIDNDQFRKYCSENELPFVIGVNEIGEAIYECLARIKHVLVAGTTGSGKSVWISQFILTLSISKQPDEMRFYMIDPKQVELPIFGKLPHTIEVITDVSKALSILNQLVKEMSNRYERFAKSQCRNIKQYNQKHQNKMDYIVVIIDEFAGLVMPCPDIKDPIIMLAQMARACGIHLVICTQRPEVEIIDGLIKANIPSRIGFKCNSVHDYKTFLDQKPPTLLGGGDGVAELEGFLNLKRFQGPVIADGDDETDEVINNIANAWHGKPVPVKQQLPELEEESESEVEEEELTPIDKAKLYICKNKDTRLRSVQKHLEIRMEAVKEIYGELVREGWLQSPEKARDGYKLILPEEKIVEFLDQYQ